jgi:hypothetical protein
MHPLYTSQFIGGRLGLREAVVAYVKVGVFLNHDTTSLVGAGGWDVYATSSFEYPKIYESEPNAI